jgi:hypothetical protein
LSKKLLVETTVVSAKPPLFEIPRETEFPNVFQEFAWKYDSSLRASLNLVLGRYFRYFPREDAGNTYLLTTFTPLQLHEVASSVLGQISLLLSFPSTRDRTNGSLPVTVKSIVREGRSHSDEFRPTSNPRILRAADEFIRSLIAELDTVGGKNP